MTEFDESYGSALIEAAEKATKRAASSNDDTDVKKAVELTRQANEYLRIQADVTKTMIEDENARAKLDQDRLIEEQKLEQQKKEAEKQRKADYTKVGIFVGGNILFAAIENHWIISQKAGDIWRKNVMPLFSKNKN